MKCVSRISLQHTNDIHLTFFIQIINLHCFFLEKNYNFILPPYPWKRSKFWKLLRQPKILHNRSFHLFQRIPQRTIYATRLVKPSFLHLGITFWDSLFSRGHSRTLSLPFNIPWRYYLPNTVQWVKDDHSSQFWSDYIFSSFNYISVSMKIQHVWRWNEDQNGVGEGVNFSGQCTANCCC